jgi:hypothetical protein
MDANERHAANYDDESTWRIDAYDNRSAAILRSVGAVEVRPGRMFDCTPLQLINYIAALHGVSVETGKKRRHLSEETKERKRQQLAAARSKIKA